MAKEVEYVVDDTFPDLSKFDGLSQDDLREIIDYIEQAEKERVKKCKGMTKEEQHAEFERANQKYEEWIADFRKKKQQITA